jgi:tRNA(fMet)-specific endonuclease VapC
MVIDTSVFIQFLRKRDKSRTLLQQIRRDTEGPLVISSITVYELFAGATDEAKKQDIERLIGPLQILTFDELAARKAADIWRNLRTQNLQIGTRDLFIAATALQHKLPVCTLNHRHFERVPGLEVISDD